MLSKIPLTENDYMLDLPHSRNDTHVVWYNTQRGSNTVDNELFSEQVQVERKMFSMELRENPRGRFLRITEDVGGRRDTIIIPATGLENIRELLDHAIAANKDAGPPDVSSAE